MHSKIPLKLPCPHTRRKIKPSLSKVEVNAYKNAIREAEGRVGPDYLG